MPPSGQQQSPCHDQSSIRFAQHPANKWREDIASSRIFRYGDPIHTSNGAKVWSVTEAES